MRQVLAWCELGRLDQVLALLRTSAHQDSGGLHTDRSTIIFTDTVGNGVVDELQVERVHERVIDSFAFFDRFLSNELLNNDC